MASVPSSSLTSDSQNSATHPIQPKRENSATHPIQPKHEVSDSHNSATHHIQPKCEVDDVATDNGVFDVSEKKPDAVPSHFQNPSLTPSLTAGANPLLSPYSPADEPPTVASSPPALDELAAPSSPSPGRRLQLAPLSNRVVRYLQMSTEEHTGAPSSSGDGKDSKKRRGRGSNRNDYHKIAKAKEIGVPINDLGQPYGPTSVQLSTSSGALATQLIPITYKSWLQVPEIMKESVWETTKNRFGLDDIAKDHVLASMCTCWRQYKSRITKQIRNIPPGPEASRRLQLLKPDNIADTAEWDKFVQFRLSPKFVEISKHYTKLAKKNETPHTTSRKGFARLREELRAAKVAKNEDPDEVDRVETWIAGHKHKDGTPMNETVAEKITEIEAIPMDSAKVIKDDAVAQVLGKEHRGRVRGLGTGVTPTKVNAAVIGRQTTAQLQAEMKDLRQLVVELQNVVLNIQSNSRPAVEERGHQTQYSSNSNVPGNNNIATGDGSSKSPLGVSTSEKGAPQKGTKCKLLHWIGSGQIVAEAEIDCTDPQALVHHKLIGPDYWRVSVKKIMVSDISLIRDTSDLQTLEDARGTTYIAWPSKYITY